jgi:hypothetical protein
VAPTRTLSLLAGRFAVCRMHPESAVPAWAEGGAWCSTTRTREELSVVCEEEAVPAGVKANRGWRMFQVQGPIPFEETGVLSAIAAPLASAGLPIFAISTFETDYLLARDDDIEAALLALRGAGHKVVTR